ncbi:hypothetical protein NLJ89_g9557 [Agrocybe chaxingu]|uniref:Uncharacterized protein n=1 Tax=Agrocybe chaxingu TaxID=84603 RepID=A0A9W8JT71_9AGAR|nr:hypothetical protein NLJ89_g9557 [Agrocybe chaxingu]
MGLFRKRDTPLRAIYRLYEWLCTNSDSEIMQEAWYFFNLQPTWVLKDIKDPKDPDPFRYAILAAVVELLALSFNKKIKLGMRRGITNKKPLMIFEFKKDLNPPYEEAPLWCAEVPGPSGTFRSRSRFMYMDLQPLFKRRLLSPFWNF